MPENTNLLVYSPAIITPTCFSGWIDPLILPLPYSDGCWIDLPTSNCSNYNSYNVYRINLNLPSECNTIPINISGSYNLQFAVAVDDRIEEVRINNTNVGLNFSSVSYNFLSSFWLNGPCSPGVNTIDFIVRNITGKGGIYLVGLNSLCADPLSLETEYFKVIHEEDYQNIIWKVSKQDIIESFCLERSTNYNDWELVCKIEKNSEGYYSCNDYFKCQESFYYRLSKLNINGTKSKLAEDFVKCENKKKLIVWPNPSPNNVFKIKLTSSIFQKVSVYSIDNKLIKEFIFDESENEQYIDLKNIEKGNYFVECNGHVAKICVL